MEPQLIGSLLPEEVTPLPSTHIYMHVNFGTHQIALHFVTYDGRCEEAIFDISPDDATGPDQRLDILVHMLAALGGGLSRQHLPVHVQRVWSRASSPLPAATRYLDMCARARWDLSVPADAEQWVDRPSYEDVRSISTIELVPFVQLH